MKNTVQQRVMDLCSFFNMSITELSKRINMPQTTVNNYLNGSRKVSYEFVESLVNSFELNANWLITGKGKMLKQDIEGGINLSNVGTGNIANAGTIGSIHPYPNNVVGSDLIVDNGVKEDKDQQILLLKNEVKHLNELLAEKERFIQVLLKK